MQEECIFVSKDVAPTRLHIGFEVRCKYFGTTTAHHRRGDLKADSIRGLLSWRISSKNKGECDEKICERCDQHEDDAAADDDEDDDVDCCQEGCEEGCEHAKNCSDDVCDDISGRSAPISIYKNRTLTAADRRRIRTWYIARYYVVERLERCAHVV